MLETTGDLWSLSQLKDNVIICITTNGYIKNNGEAVMGRGCAYQAKNKYKDLPIILGRKLATKGNHVYELIPNKLFSFPVKNNWNEVARLDLIKRSAEELMIFVYNLPKNIFLLPKPGCGNGGLDWQFVKPEIKDILNDQVFIVDYV